MADLNNEVIWIVSPCLLISKSSTPFSNPLRIVPSAPITISLGIFLPINVLLILLCGLPERQSP